MKANIPVIVGAWHDTFGFRAKQAMSGATSVVVMGANSIAPLAGRSRKTRFGITDGYVARKKVILFGVGASSKPLGRYSRLLWRDLLDPIAPHSARDEQAAELLVQLGIKERAIFLTGCPTTWELPHTKTDGSKADHVIYLDTPRDSDEFTRGNLAELTRRYATVSVFAQSARATPRAGVPDGVRRLQGGLEEFESRLRATDEARVDVVGTRLHGGIRAMQLGRRALIFAIDHRARQQAKISGVPVTESTDSRAAIAHFASDGWRPYFCPPEATIGQWRQALEEYWCERLASM